MPASPDTALLIEHLDVRFGAGESGVHAVRDLSLAVGRGESFGLVGESGSGKSTVLRAVAGLVRDWTGRIAVDGIDLGAKRTAAFYATVQMVFQDPYGSLHPRHTVDRTLGESGRIHGLPDVDARVLELLGQVGLGPEFRFRYPNQLSGGQRQRVAIARALMPGPRILLLDEPTSALDVSVQAEILNLLQGLRREHGLTYVLVSHDLAVVAHMCDRLAVMNAGRVVEEMTVDQLRRSAPSHPYTRQLLTASLGYDRSAVDALETFE